MNGWDWYQEGATVLLGQQLQSGAWKRAYPETLDTCFALLFLKRSAERRLDEPEIDPDDPLKTHPRKPKKKRPRRR